MRLVYLTLGWTAGLLLAVDGEPGTWPLWLLFSFLAGGLLVWMWPQRSRWGYIALVAFMLGGLRASLIPQTSDLASYNASGGLTITGHVTAEPDIRDTVTLLRVRAETVTLRGETLTASGNALVRAPRTTSATYGDTVQVTGRIESPGVYDTFSYADFLARQGVFSIMRDTVVEVTETGGGNPIYRGILRAKGWAASQINLAMPEPEAGLLVGILLGNESGLSSDLQDDFAATGAAHIIAISGFNMAILAGVVIALLDQTPLRGIRAGLLALGVIGVYTVFVGAGAAEVRAAMMSGVLVIGTALKRQAYVPASLAFVACLMSAYNPRVLYSVSFQLSFFATLGLALFATPFTRLFESLLVMLFSRSVSETLSRLLSESLVVSLAALVTTIPLTVMYFNRLSLVQLPVNVLIVPVQPLVLFGGIIATLVSVASPTLAQPIYWFTMMLLQWTVSIVRGFASLPFTDIAFYADTTLIQGFFIIIIGGAILQATQPTWALNIVRVVISRAVLSTLGVIGIVMLALGAATYAARPDGQLHVHMLDVGHSSGFLVETPGGAQILVDGGRFPSRLLTQIGDRMPFNDRHIEVVVVTQPDPFTYGAVPAVLERYSAGVVLTNGQPNEGDEYAAFLDTVAPYPTVNVVAGYHVELDDGTLLEILAPQITPTLADSLDDNTILLRLSYNDVSFLFTSDLSGAGQANALDTGTYPLATVLQLPQHATARSLNTEFISQTQAQLYLLHNDKANRRGDPNPDTLALLNPDIPLYRTDVHGSVHIWTDGQNLWVRPDVR